MEWLKDNPTSKNPEEMLTDEAFDWTYDLWVNVPSDDRELKIPEDISPGIKACILDVLKGLDAAAM